jgi:hypothetical protein
VEWRLCFRGNIQSLAFLVQNRTATISIPAELMEKKISKIKELCEMLVVMSLAECSMDR